MLRFGYISALLVLERWELAQMTVEPTTGCDETSSSSASDVDVLTQSIIDSALTVLSDVGIMTSTFGTIPTYDILLGAYAGVTLVQFADSLSDLRGASEVMLRVDQQRRTSRSRDQVLTWASNMMQKKLLDLDSEGSGDFHQDIGQWLPLGVIDTVGNNATLT